MKGFALFVSVLFLLILTLFGFCMLMAASNYYSASHNLFDKENARLACESARIAMILRHNTAADSPRFFFNPVCWNGPSLNPFAWHGYLVKGTLGGPWNPLASNTLLLSVRRGNFIARQSVQLRQLRFENFALFSDEEQTFTTSPLFDGRAFSRDGILLTAGGTVFRDYVHSDVHPEFIATFRKRSLEKLDLPSLAASISLSDIKNSFASQFIIIKDHHPLFWQSNHYELNLDNLLLQQTKTGWRISYGGIDLGTSTTPALWFDDRVAVRQQNWPPPLTDPAKPRVPLYLFSDNGFTLHSNLNPLESAVAIHPLALVAATTLEIAGDVPRACRIDAMLLGIGVDPMTSKSMFIKAGGSVMSEIEKSRFRTEVLFSAFLVEDQKREELLADLNADRKIVWFKNSLVLSGGMEISPDLAQIHFQSSGDLFSLFPSFPYVYEVQGSRQWQ